MNKIGFGITIKMPIQGVQYSNVENWVSWEEETELGFDEALKEQKEHAIKGREWINEVGSEAAGDIQNQLEDSTKRLEKAREEFIKLKTK